MLSRLLGEHIQIHTELASGLWDVFADPGQMDQIVLNLAVNARDAMESGGILAIATANVERAAALAQDLAAGEYVRLSVSDTGQGMDEETQRHIFEPFFTTKEVGRGTGLGLSTVYGSSCRAEDTSGYPANPAKAARSPSTCPARPTSCRPRSREPPAPRRRSPAPTPSSWWKTMRPSAIW
jgi:hypothetical protein